MLNDTVSFPGVLNDIVPCVIVVGSVLIFVTKKSNCEELANNLRLKDFNGELMSSLLTFILVQSH